MLSSIKNKITSVLAGCLDMLLLVIDFILKPFVTLIVKPLTVLIVEEWVPRYIKELLYLASIYGVLNDINMFSESCNLEDINNNVALVKNPAALRLPFFTAHFIWDKHHDEINFIRLNLNAIKEDKEKLSQAAETIVNLSPSWIMYDRRRNIIASVMEVIMKSNPPKMNLNLS